MIIVATPGFVSHDWWQKFDHIRLYDFPDSVGACAAGKAGPEFGHPMRPIGLLQQGVVALSAQDVAIRAARRKPCMSDGIPVITFDPISR